MREIIGDRVRKYLIITCPHCKESYRIDWKEIVKGLTDNYTNENPFPKIVCPWCENELPDEQLGATSIFQIVKEV